VTLRVLVTAGPTVEAIDDVRYISNRSSGKMGYAVAAAACEAGCDVTLVTGPVSLSLPNACGGRLVAVRVESARDMAAAALAAFARADIAFHVAAVADFRPAKRVKGKIKKKRALRAGRGRVRLELVPNPDILWSCGKVKRDRQILVGFALEAAGGEANALEKLRDKNLDFVVWNDPSSLNAERANVTVLGRNGERIPIHADKARIGRKLVSLALTRWRQLQQPTRTNPSRRSRRESSRKTRAQAAPRLQKKK
jgi:phosphopantothenoylcysteine decarboxylase/phosphopantothenate--cysteine ligase